MDKRPLQKHSKLSKTLWNPSVVGSIYNVLRESLEASRMYYAIGVSVSSLHRESTDSLVIPLMYHTLSLFPHIVAHLATGIIYDST